MTSEVNMARFKFDCQVAIDKAIDEPWPGTMVLRSLGLGVGVSFIPHDDTAGDLFWSAIDGAAMAGLCQEMMVDDLPAIFLTGAPKDPLLGAIFRVRHGDGRWEDIDAGEAPMLSLSTAGAIREFLLTGKRAPMRFATDRRLFGTIVDEPPPVHEDGLL